MDRRLVMLVLLTGVNAMAGQLLLVREFMLAFPGSEFTLGVFLAAWLLLTGLGSLAAGRRAVPSLVLLPLCSGLSLVFGVLAFRSLPWLVTNVPGEIAPPLTILGCALLVLAPFCAISGASFAMSCRAAGAAATGSSGSRFYQLETLGALLTGGLAAAYFWLVRDQVLFLILLGGVNLGAALWLRQNSPSHVGGTRSRLSRNLPGLLSILLLFALLALPSLAPNLEGRRWPDATLLESRDSAYGHVSVIRNAEQISVFFDGALLYSYPEYVHAEELTHLPLLLHSQPRRVLLVGGGLFGMAAEILKHRPERLDILEFDPIVTETAARYLPPACVAPLSAPATQLLTGDAVRYLRDLPAVTRYDTIIINVGEPATLLANRCFTREFFRHAASHLTDGGILAVSLPGGDGSVHPSTARMLASLQLTLASVFAGVLPLPGPTFIFLASSSALAAETLTAKATARWRDRGLACRIINDIYLEDRLARDKRDWYSATFRRVTVATGDDLVNSAANPRLHALYQVYWNAVFHSDRFNLTEFLWRQWRSALVLLLLSAGVWCTVAWPRSPVAVRRTRTGLILVSGFSGMAAETLVALQYQVRFGCLYSQLALIFGLYMAGLAAGSHVARRGTSNPRHLGTWLGAAFVGTMVACAVLPLLAPLSDHAATAKAAQFALVGAFPLLLGFYGGAQFVLTLRWAELDTDAAAHAALAGRYYGLDLCAAGAGALVVGAFLIPAAGMVWSCVLLAALNAAAGVLTVRQRASPA